MHKIISPTIQEFSGLRFYLCGKYFQRDGLRMHVFIWESKNGKVPKGFHVHHKDNNRSNNTLENLEMLSAHEHLSHHAKNWTLEQIKRNKEHMAKIRPLTVKWHGSRRGRRWHSQHAKKVFSNQSRLEKVCIVCKKDYSTVVSQRDRKSVV